MLPTFRSTTLVRAAASMLVLMAGCASEMEGPLSTGVARTSTPDPTVVPSAQPRPIGLVAIGHSFMTGEGSAAGLTGEPIPENSWATGTNPEVNSIYLRMVEAIPETGRNVANVARGGAAVTDLPAQVNTALFVVPHPRLLLLRAIDNDIRCDGSDEENVVEFGETLAQTLAIVAEKSPETTIIVLGQLASPASDAAQFEDLPDVRQALGGTGMCDFFDPDGELVPEALDTLTAIIGMYEAEQQRVCAEVPQCITDPVAEDAFEHRLEYVSDDYSHYNVVGQAAVAEHLWPTVAEALGIGQ